MMAALNLMKKLCFILEGKYIHTKTISNEAETFRVKGLKSDKPVCNIL
jgi:hypothetical protein